MRGGVFQAFTIGIAMALLYPGSAGAADPRPVDSAPRVKPPSFPLEPDAKPAQPVDPSTYVEPLSAPPKGDAEAVIVRQGRDADAWWNSIELGWFYVNHTAKHSFSASGAQNVRRMNTSPLGLRASLELWPPKGPLSFAFELSGTKSRGEATAADSSMGRIEFDSQDFRGRGGVRIHFFRSTAQDLRAGVDFEGCYSTFVTLTGSQTKLDIDNRVLALLIPKLEYRYSGDPNWSLQLGAGYGAALKASGTGNVIGNPYQRIDLEAGTLRYLSPGNGLGLGLSYSSESATWTQTSPTLTDQMSSSDLRLSFFWRRDF